MHNEVVFFSYDCAKHRLSANVMNVDNVVTPSAEDEWWPVNWVPYDGDPNALVTEAFRAVMLLMKAGLFEPADHNEFTDKVNETMEVNE